VLSAGTVAGMSVVGKVLVEFGINNRTPTAAAIRSEMDANSSNLSLAATAANAASVKIGNFTGGDTIYDWLGEPVSTSISADIAATKAAAEAAGEQTTPVSQVPVPALRTWTLKEASTGLVGETSRKMRVGESKIFAINFAADLPTNGRLTDFDSIAIETGTAGGVTFDTSTDVTFGVDKTLAKIEITGVTAGTYVLEATVTYTSDSGGGTSKAQVTLVVGA